MEIAKSLAGSRASRIERLTTMSLIMPVPRPRFAGPRTDQPAAGGMLPMGSRSRRLLNQSTHSSVENSTASNERHRARRWMSSAL